VAQPSGVAAPDVARDALRTHGRGALLPYQLGPDAVPFAIADGSGAIAYARAGKTAVMLGEPVGADEAAAAAVLDRWLEQCRASRWRAGIYQAAPELTRRLRSQGWRAYLIGLEAVVDLPSFTIRSPRVANVRHTVTRAGRGGVVATWSGCGLAAFADPDAVLAGMTALDAAWRATAGPQMGFTVGRFEPASLDGCGVAVARDGSGQVTAFAILRPTGTDADWMLDLMRRHRNGVPGAVEACIKVAVESLRDSGAERLSLGLAPLYGLDPRVGPMGERTLALAARAAKPFYDYPGLAFFKNKFAPTWEPRYLLVPRAADFVPVLSALLRLHLGGSWSSMVRGVVASLRPAAVPPTAAAAPAQPAAPAEE